MQRWPSGPDTSSIDQAIGGRSGGGSPARLNADSTVGNFEDVMLEFAAYVDRVDVLADIVA